MMIRSNSGAPLTSLGLFAVLLAVGCSVEMDPASSPSELAADGVGGGVATAMVDTKAVSQPTADDDGEQGADDDGEQGADDQGAGGHAAGDQGADDDQLPPNTCPSGWVKYQKSCKGLSQNGNSPYWFCMQSLPSKTITEYCDSDQLKSIDEKCYLSLTDFNETAVWCENPSAPLICGGKVCNVPAKGNKCVLAGPQNSFSFCP
jgi:hypothetical protein